MARRSHYTPTERQHIVEQVALHGDKPAVICERWGIAAVTLYLWLKKAGYVPRHTITWVKGLRPGPAAAARLHN